jgi:dihydroorotase
VELIRTAKAGGLQVSCGVAAHHLVLTDDALFGFDTNYKVMPPLRLASDRAALLAGVLDGTIDVICSDHQPEDTEHKFLEFDLAKPGIAGIETAFALVAAAFSEQELPVAIAALNSRPRQLLGLTEPLISPGETANLVVFDLGERQPMAKLSLRTKGVNNPFVNQDWKAPLRAVVRANHHYLTHEK